MTYATSLTLNASGAAYRRSAVSRFHRPVWAFVVLGAGLILAVAYLLLVNDTATVGLSIRSQEGKIESLQESNRQLEVQLANLQSFATIERAGHALELTDHATPGFVAQPGGSVAVR